MAELRRRSFEYRKLAMLALLAKLRRNVLVNEAFLCLLNSASINCIDWENILENSGW
jgi:hypothetical protein